MPANAATRTSQRFTDVTPDKWYYEAVNTLVDAGIVNGYGSGEFKPNNPMTAGELAAVLWNMMYGDWCKANELYNIFSNGYAEADYKKPNYPAPRLAIGELSKTASAPIALITMMCTRPRGMAASPWPSMATIGFRPTPTSAPKAP